MILIHKKLHIKYLFMITVITFLLSALTTGCGKNSGETGGGEKIVLTSFYPMYIAALNVTENIPGIRLVNMASPSVGCLHDYQLTTSDAALLEKASVLIVNGGGMEEFLEKAVSLNKNLMVIDASDGFNTEFIQNRRSKMIDDYYNNYRNHRHRDHSHHSMDDDTRINPHVWLSIDNYVKQVKNIAKHLSAWDTVNSGGYTKNAQTFAASLQEFKTEAVEKLSNISNKEIVIFHEGFFYFDLEFGLKTIGVVEREPGVEPSAAEIIMTLRSIKESNVKALFAESQHTPALAKAISAESGLPLFTLDPVVSGPMTKDAYITAMRKNIETVKRALE